MSLTQSLSNALSGLTAASRMAEVVSANLANALTDGYGRRAVDLSAQTVGYRGAGVQIDGIARLVDRGVLADRRAAESRLEGRSPTPATLGRVETALGDAKAGTSLAARITALESALTAAAADPSSEIALTRIGGRLTELATGLRDAAAAIQSERLSADAQIAADVDSLNRSLVALEESNTGIATATARGHDVSALLDQRQKIVDTIARIVPVREIDRPSGQIALVTTGGEVLIDGRARQYGFDAVHTVTADMTHASGALSGLSWNGQPVDPLNGIGRLDGGTLGAAMQLRDTLLPDRAAAVDALAADLVARFADPGTDPTLGAMMPGLLTDAGGLPDPADITGLASRITVNAAVDPARGGDLWRLRDGVGAILPGPVGDSTRINAWADALGRQTLIAGGGPAAGAADHAARLIAAIGNDRLVAEEAEAQAAAGWSALRETELAGGVDSDHEMQMLLRIEQAYAANARVMTTLDEMMRTLLEI